MWLLGVFLASAYGRSDVPRELRSETRVDEIDFVSNDSLRRVLAVTSATPQQVEEVVAINEAARLRALRASFLIVGGTSLLAIFPASRLPRYAPSELSAAEILDESERAP